MHVIKFSQLPKQSAEHGVSSAARVLGYLDELAKKLNTKPYKYKSGEGLHGPIYLKRIYFQLDTGVGAAICEDDVVAKYESLLVHAVSHPITGNTHLDVSDHYKPGNLEVELYLDDHRYFYEEDLSEVIEFLCIDPGQIRKNRDGSYWKSKRAFS